MSTENTLTDATTSGEAIESSSQQTGSTENTQSASSDTHKVS